MRLRLIISGILLFSSVYFSQTKEIIKKSDHYYWGEASAESELEASDHALSMLTRQIAITVSSSFESIVSETNTTLTESAKKVINTYSSATIRDVKTISEPDGKNIRIFKYIQKSEVEKIFAERLKLIYNIYQKALTFEEKNNLAQALKWYYFCTILRNSIPETNAVYEGVKFDVELSSHINNIKNSLSFSVVEDNLISDNEREVKFRITTGGKPVQTLDFYFWDGTGQSIVSAQDGFASVKLYGSSIKFEKLDLMIKYSYYESRNEIKEVGELWDLVIKPQFSNSFSKNIQVETVAANHPGKVSADNLIKNSFRHGKYSLSVYSQDSCHLIQNISNEAFQFLSLIESSDDSQIKKYFRNDLLAKKIASLIKYNRPRIADKIIEAEINKTAFGWELRKIRLIDSYPSIKKQTPEYLILDFDENGVLYDFSFGITEGLYKDFLDQSKFSGDWGNRQIIIKFLENYRTAFMTRDIALLDSLFAEDAVIIIGKVLSKKHAGEVYKYIRLNDQQPDVNYMTYTKKEYLKNQRQVFLNQKDLYVGYSTFKISKKNNTQGVYGVSMRQNYNATNYADEGHLFLLIDFQDKDPQIYVRSWQPQEWNEEALIQLSNFNINR